MIAQHLIFWLRFSQKRKASWRKKGKALLGSQLKTMNYAKTQALLMKKNFDLNTKSLRRVFH